MSRRQRSLVIPLLAALCVLEQGCGRERWPLLEPGDPIPPFRVTLLRPDGGTSILDSDTLRAAPGRAGAILAFMSDVRAPDSVQELESLRDAAYWLGELDMRLYAVARNEPRRMREVMRRSKLPFPLISDREGTFAERFGAWDAQRDCIRRTTIVIRCGFSHAAWASDIARRIDVSTHGDDLIRRSEGENRSRVHHRLPPGQSIHEPCYREGLLRVTILGPGRLAENPELIRSGKPPILFDGTPVESLSELRRALLQSFDPRRHPGELGFDGITPRPPIAASDGSLHAASARPLRIDCEWDQVFGWTQAVTLCATRLPGESLDSLVRESPRVLMMEWGTRGAPSWIRFPDSMGFVDPTVHDPMAARLVLEVSPDERAYDPPSRRVAFYVDDDARPLGYCFGMRLVPSDPAFCSLTFARLRDAEMILDPPDLVRRIDARLGRRRSRHIEFHCSPFVCHGLVDELFSMVGELRRSEVTLRTLPGLFAELEAGRIR